MKLEFYGASDDLIEIRIDGKDYEEIGGYISNDKSIHSKTLHVTTIGGSEGVKVHMLYDGCWTGAVGQLEEGRSLPRGWKITTEQEHAYSSKVCIDTGSEVAVVTFADGKSVQGGQESD